MKAVVTIEVDDAWLVARHERWWASYAPEEIAEGRIEKGTPQSYMEVLVRELVVEDAGPLALWGVEAEWSLEMVP